MKIRLLFISDFMGTFSYGILAGMQERVRQSRKVSFSVVSMPPAKASELGEEGILRFIKEHEINLVMVSSVPSISIDMCEAILSVPAIQFGEVSDKMLLIKTEFTDDIKIEGYFVLVPDLESYEKILSSLGM